MRTALHLYEDFLQKKKVAQLWSIQKGRKDLPIAGFADQIVRTVKANRVTIVAGTP